MSNAARVIPAAAVLVLVGLATDASAQTGAARCAGTAQIVRAQSSGVRTTTVNFNTDALGNPDPTGYFDPKPLIATAIVTTAANTCLIAHFSALAEPQDNHVMFQVRVDGKPMQGHAIFPGFGLNGLVTTHNRPALRRVQPSSTTLIPSSYRP